ncbi:hypothetical protein GGTG_02466 [Gaeumannomyces tritici R3-111a-1]|uniref:Uncharacterized protein n=1 Tax=Gaeumannomyces tritici (strain R3-111a-1) TaxID=644352 RepID=J3NMG2_GAET3|nr:hypothetical protein GGTG_02466 [Gaeumannomyces tritici R3-111a-1]EJT82493.1 hypothetical protein GGTG_02466 [Gaeumannomyces tritici R3-111a-1]
MGLLKPSQLNASPASCRPLHSHAIYTTARNSLSPKMPRKISPRTTTLTRSSQDARLVNSNSRLVLSFRASRTMFRPINCTKSISLPTQTIQILLGSHSRSRGWPCIQAKLRHGATHTCEFSSRNNILYQLANYSRIGSSYTPHLPRTSQAHYPRTQVLKAGKRLEGRH